MLLFSAFVFACGTTHLVEAFIFWFPVYRLAGLLKVATASVSWVTVAAFVPVLPTMLAMRFPDGRLEGPKKVRFVRQATGEGWDGTRLPPG